ncbi:MAG TPA: hypothetical protein VEK74_07285 [Burkholderiaceae bacterium]|nr:hypothetical protein [Burkholderiaceae bacterium]
MITRVRTHIPTLMSILILAACGGGGSGSGNSGSSGSGSGSGSGAGFPATQYTDLCSETLVNNNNRKLVNYSPLAKPTKGQPVTDPDFGTTIVRITDAQTDWAATIGSASVAIPVYPTVGAWNADESLLFLYVTSSTFQGWGLFDGKTYAFKQWLNINPADIEEVYWDTLNPDLLYFINNNQGTYAQLTRYHVSTGTTDILHDFFSDMAAGGVLNGVCPTNTLFRDASHNPFMPSQDNDLFGVGCELNQTDPVTGEELFAAFAYRVSTGTIVNTPVSGYEVMFPEPLPSDRGMFTGTTTSSETLNTNTNAVLQTFAWNGWEHEDLLRSASGDDLIAGAQYDDPSGSGTIMWADLTKGGAVNTLIGPATGLDPYPPSGTLLSGTAFTNPGWIAEGTTGNIQATSTYIDQEVIVANLDTGKFCRVAHHRSTGDWSNATQSNYWAQPNVILSPSGTRILFASDWGAATPGSSVTANPNAVVDTYVIELPTYSP